MTTLADAHFHWWDTSQARYPWLETETAYGFGPAHLLPKRALPKHYRAQFGQMMRPAVHVEAGILDGMQVTEVDRIRELSTPDVKAVARIDLLDDAKTQLDALDGRAVGVRHIASWDESPKWTFLEDPKLLSNVRSLKALSAIAEAGLVFEAQIYPTQAGQLASVAAQYSTLKIVVEHSGMPRWWAGKSAEQEWLNAMVELSAHDNIALKLGGFGMTTGTFDEPRFASICAAALELFGTSRIMFGSNWPVEGLRWDPSLSVDLYLQAISSLSDTDHALLKHDNVFMWYRGA